MKKFHNCKWVEFPVPDRLSNSCSLGGESLSNDKWDNLSNDKCIQKYILWVLAPLSRSTCNISTTAIPPLK